MTFEIFSSLKSHIIRWPRHLLMVGGLCLLVACGGGGGGGSDGGTTPSAAYTAPSAPNPSLVRTDGGNTINPGYQATFVPLFSYGTGKLSASDGSFTNRSVNSGEAIVVTPQTSTTYTLVVNYQDPTTVRTSILQTTPVTLTVTVNTLPDIVPNVTLAIDTTSVLTGGNVTLTPQFSVPAGLALDLSSTGILTNNVESSLVQVSTSGVAIPRTNLQADTTYTLRVTYIDTRYAANPKYPKTDSKTVVVSTGAGTIGKAADMNVARSDFSATALHNGQVLVCGGVTSTGTVLTSCELYDPFFGSWTVARPMATARRGHAASLLRSGKVLVSGGYDGTVTTTALKTTEIYDPGSNSWSAGAALIEARTGHTSTLLNNDKVLIVGGAVSSGKGTVVELFDASTLTGTITATGSLNVPRQEHTTTLLPNGLVLVVGRNDSEGSLFNASGQLVDASSTELFDPSTGTWSLGPTLAYGRRNHATTLINATLSNIQVLVTGGSGVNASTTAEVLTRSTATSPATWSKQTVAMPNGRSFHTGTLLDSGDVLLAGGKNAALTDLDTTDVFTFSTLSFSPSAQKKLNYARSMHKSVKLTSSAVLIVGNYFTNAGTVDKKAELWSPP